MSHLSDLEAENANLRELIAASADVAAAFSVVEMDRELDDLRARVTAAMAELAAATGRIEFGGCPFCGEAWPHYPDATPESRMEIAAEHDARCPRNPLRIERDALRSTLIHLGSLQMQRWRDAAEAWAIRQTANDLREPFSTERMEARIAAALAKEPK